jgi:hypothetical protein
MSLKDILEKLIETEEPVLLCANGKEWEPAALLESLSEPMLKRKAHIQPGLYIAALTETGYLGQVMYKLKKK